TQYTDAEEHLKALHQVHNLKLETVQIRGCNLGQSEVQLKLLCLFLGAARLVAPQVPDYFATVTPQLIRSPTEFHREVRRQKGVIATLSAARCPGPHPCEDKGAKITYSFTGRDLLKDRNELALFFDEPPKRRGAPREPGNIKLLVEHQDALMYFVMLNFGPPHGGFDKLGKGVLPGHWYEQPLPVQWLGTTRPIFPQSTEFQKHLREVTPGRFNLSTGQVEPAL